ncbi:MAG TPA: hypothetical protein VLZ81_00235, partial [Blastocatellia bacterium]|nr:hypothetical protein [Blastocatellia bacterium]
MNLQEQPYTKPQPIRVSLDAPAEQLYGLANNLRTDESARKAFERSPQEIMREFGLQTSAIRWDLAPKHEKGGDKGHGGKKHGESEAEVVIACIGAASD